MEKYIELKRKLAKKIFKLRTKANVTQDQLARKIRTSGSTISRIEHQSCSLYLLQRIAEELGYDIEIRFKKL